MKRIFCLITALCIVFGSFSFCFASPVSWDSSDSQHLTEIRNAFVSGGTIYNMINALNSNVVNINSNLVTLMGWLDPSSGGGTTALLNQILNALVYTNAGGSIISWLQDLSGYSYQSSQWIYDLRTALTHPSSWSSALRYSNGHYNLTADNGSYQWDRILPNGGRDAFTYYWSNGSPIGNIGLMMYNLNRSNALQYQYRWGADLYGYNSTQTGLSWTDIEQSVTFTPDSSIDGTYKWLKNIQAPVARLAYVLASDERIAAQEAAAANEEAVVDNFIDSTGDGSASTSDIGFISDLSSGYKSNFGSDASVSGIFNIFNSNNMGWFSQETANQLDTTTANRRGSSFDTPLLDQQIEDIYDQIGVKHD